MITRAIDEMQQRLESELKLVGDDIRKVSQKAETDVQASNSKATNELRELKVRLLLLLASSPILYHLFLTMFLIGCYGYESR